MDDAVKKYFIFFIITSFFLLLPGKAWAILPANPNATLETRQLLNYFFSLPSKTENRVISGQHVGSSVDGTFPERYDTYITNVNATPKQTIGLIGADFSYCGSDNNSMLSKIKEHWNKGGLVTISWHITNPWSGDGVNCFVNCGSNNAYCSCVATPPYTNCGHNSDLNIGANGLAELYEPQYQNNLAYIRFHKDLDTKADYLLDLQNSNPSVSVLFRPFHEMNGTSWMWWTARENWTTQQFADHATKYKALWRHVFNYYKDKQINNVLWVFSPANYYLGIGKPDSYYPGDDVVDIVGLDYYYHPDYYGSWEDMFKNLTAADSDYAAIYQSFFSHPKPFAITEFGPGSGGFEPAKNSFDYAILIQQIKKYIPNTIYFLPWSGTYAIVNQYKASELLNDPWVANTGEINWKTSCSLKSQGDFNCDGKINESDLNTLLGKWMTSVNDLTGDNIVNESDLNKLLGNWKTS